MLRQRREEVKQARERGEQWLSPAERLAVQQKAAEAAQDARQDLRFEVAAARYLDRYGEGYAVPKEVAGLFRRLGRAFNGRLLDEVGKADVQEYIDNRLTNTGPFADSPRKVSLRVPQTEVAALSSLYTFLQDDEDREVTNPCERVWARRRKRRKSATYRPAREAIIPTDEELRALFDAAPTPTFRAAWMVCYYGAARPESETCKLKHGDVALSNPKVRTLDGKPKLGTITFRETKTGDDREIPLHPEAEVALREIMLPEPSGAAQRATWADTPIFRKRGSSEPWNRHSYKKSWTLTLGEIAKEHPRLQRMVVRDFRTAANTRMREQGIDGAMASRILGHSEEINVKHYTRVTDSTAQRAILTLSPNDQGSDIGVGHEAAVADTATTA